MTCATPKTRSPNTVTRRLAEVLGRQARTLMPRSRRDWGDAMRNELEHIADDRGALRWAVGCLVGAIAERVRSRNLGDLAIVRAAVASALAFKAFDAVLATMLTFAYRWDSAALLVPLGRLTPGDNYERLVPLIEGVPSWLHVLSLLCGAAYAQALVRFLRRSDATHRALMAAVGLEAVIWWLSDPIVEAIGVAAHPSPSLVVHALSLAVVPLSIALVAWSGSDRRAL
jgi:hypothetical protein